MVLNDILNCYINEKFIYNKLIFMLESNKILTPPQHDFRKKTFYSNCSNDLIQKIYNKLDMNDKVVALLRPNKGFRYPRS